MLAQRVKENQLPRTAAPSQREYFTSTGPPSMGTKPGLIVAVTAAAALGASSPQDGDESLESWTGKPAFSGLCFFTERAETRHCPFPIPCILIHTKNTAAGHTASAVPHLPPGQGWNGAQMEKAQVSSPPLNA